MQELAAHWQGVTAALGCGDQPALAQAALRFAYYWYNFMPLARGTALVGYVTILALFLAADMPITQPAPKVPPLCRLATQRACVQQQLHVFVLKCSCNDSYHCFLLACQLVFWTALLVAHTTKAALQGYQLDWEAILRQRPEDFVAEVSRWMLPPQARSLQTPPGERTVHGVHMSSSGSPTCTAELQHLRAKHQE